MNSAMAPGQMVWHLLRCPQCRGELDKRGGAEPLLHCSPCASSYPTVCGIPLLLPKPEMQLRRWRHGLAQFVQQMAHSEKQLLVELLEGDLSERGQRRVRQVIDGLQLHRQEVVQLMALGGIAAENSPAGTVGQDHFSPETYFKLIHRDYAWHSWARIWQTPLLGELAMLLTSRWLLRREMALQAPGVPLEVVDAAYDRMHRTMKATVLRWYRSHARPAEVFDPWEDRLLAALENIPARVVWGDQDPYIPARIADRFGVEAVHLTDYGHWLHLQAPDVVAGHLAALLRDGRR